MDFPGFDHSETPARKYTIDDFTDAALDLMDDAGLEKAHVVGSHTGAVVGMNLAARAPERVGKLVVEDSPGWNLDEGRTIFEKFFKPTYGEDGLPQPTPLEAALARNPDLDREKHERQNQVVAANPAWIRGCHEANTSFDVQALMRRVRIPTLVIFEEGDPLRRREQRFVDEIKGARLVVIPGANDEAHYHRPEEFVREVIPFLEG
jgi:pimeloyl-ACP methyl ester carboxylesterase